MDRGHRAKEVIQASFNDEENNDIFKIIDNR